MSRRALKVIVIVWVGLWAFLFLRELFIKNNFRDYKVLLSRDLEGKRSFVTGDRLYELIKAAKRIIPEGSNYRMVGLEKGSVDSRRSEYYLYPRMAREPAEYIIVYDLPGRVESGYVNIASLDGQSSIFEKKEMTDSKWICI